MKPSVRFPVSKSSSARSFSNSVRKTKPQNLGSARGGWRL